MGIFCIAVFSLLLFLYICYQKPGLSVLQTQNENAQNTSMDSDNSKGRKRVFSKIDDVRRSLLKFINCTQSFCWSFSPSFF